MLGSITVSTYILLLILSSTVGIVVGIVGHLLLDLYRSRRGAGESSPPAEPSPSPRGGLRLSEITWEEALEFDATDAWDMILLEAGCTCGGDWKCEACKPARVCPKFGDCQGCDVCS